jgi:hypothetical protein
LHRCCNKPVISAALLAIGTDSLHESSTPTGAFGSLQFSYSSPKDYMATWLQCLPGVSLSNTIAALRQLAFVHEEFLERGQEVSRVLFLTSLRNFS